MYMGLQKILILVMIVIEAAPNLVGGFMRPDPVIAQQFFGGNLFAVSFLIFLQICIGGVLIFLMDEVVTKWGIGSGVGLFIIAGISQAIVNGFINWAPVTDQYPVGFFPRLVAIGLDGGNYITYFGKDILAFITTIAIFLIIVYVESTRIEIPLAHAQVRGARARFPVKLIYASVLPMILVRVLQANIQMVGMFLSNVGITIFGMFNGSTPDKWNHVVSCPDQRSYGLDVVDNRSRPCAMAGSITYGSRYHIHGSWRCDLRAILDQNCRAGFKGCRPADPAFGDVHPWLPQESAGA